MFVLGLGVSVGIGFAIGFGIGGLDVVVTASAFGLVLDLVLDLGLGLGLGLFSLHLLFWCCCWVGIGIGNATLNVCFFNAESTKASNFVARHFWKVCCQRPMQCNASAYLTFCGQSYASLACPVFFCVCRRGALCTCGPSRANGRRLRDNHKLNHKDSVQVSFERLRGGMEVYICKMFGSKRMI